MGSLPVPQTLSLKMKGSTTFYAGALVMLNAGGFALPGAAAASQTAAGRAKVTKTNSGSDGDVSIEVERGTFKFENYGSDPVVQGDVLKTCYIFDDETVAHSDGTGARSAAGKVIALDADGGVWVQVGG